MFSFKHVINENTHTPYISFFIIDRCLLWLYSKHLLLCCLGCNFKLVPNTWIHICSGATCIFTRIFWCQTPVSNQRAHPFIEKNIRRLYVSVSNWYSICVCLCNSTNDKVNDYQYGINICALSNKILEGFTMILHNKRGSTTYGYCLYNVNNKLLIDKSLALELLNIIYFFGNSILKWYFDSKVFVILFNFEYNSKPTLPNNFYVAVA